MSLFVYVFIDYETNIKMAFNGLTNTWMTEKKTFLIKSQWFPGDFDWLVFFLNDDFWLENKQNWLMPINYGNHNAFVFADVHDFEVNWKKFDLKTNISFSDVNVILEKYDK